MKEIFVFSYRTSQIVFHFFKKAVFVLLVFVAIVSAFYYVTLKDISFKSVNLEAQNRKYIYDNVNRFAQDKTDLGRLRFYTYTGFMCSTTGEACTPNPSDAIKNQPYSLAGGISKLFSIPYSRPPASSIAWINTSLEEAGFIPKTYAAEGIGFASIKGYMSIWTLFRNLSYMLLVLVMVSIGFMIMFRVQLDAQTAMSLQSALPRIVMALLLITFSFAIAGFLIDLMYIVITLLISIVFKIGVGPYTPANMADAQNTYMAASFWNLWPIEGSHFMSVGYAFWNLIPGIYQFLLTAGITIPVSIGIAELLSNFFGLPIARGTSNWGLAGFTWGGAPFFIQFILNLLLFGGLSYIIPGFLIAVILLLTLLLHIFRVFFLLLNSYIKICLYIMFAPFILMFTAIPGNNSFGWWFKNLFGELLVFPTVIVIMLTGHIMLVVNNIPSPTGVDTTFRLPFMYGFDAKAFNAIVSMGIVLLIPDFIKIVKGFVGVTDSPLNFGIGTFFAGAGIFTGGLGTIDQIENLKATLVGRDYQHPRGILHLLAPGLAKRIEGIGK